MPPLDASQFELVAPPASPRKTGAYTGPPPPGVPASIGTMTAEQQEAFVRQYATVGAPPAPAVDASQFELVAPPKPQPLDKSRAASEALKEPLIDPIDIMTHMGLGTAHVLMAPEETGAEELVERTAGGLVRRLGGEAVKSAALATGGSAGINTARQAGESQNQPRPAYDPRAVEQLEGGGLQAPTIDPVDLLAFGGIGALESIPESIGKGLTKAGLEALRRGIGTAAGIGLMSKTGEAVAPAVQAAIPGQGPLSQVARGTIGQLASVAPLVGAGTLANIRTRAAITRPFEEPAPKAAPETPVTPPEPAAPKTAPAEASQFEPVTLSPNQQTTFVSETLGKAGKGEPGLSVEKAGRLVVYRAPNGDPVSVAETLPESASPQAGLATIAFATDKNKGALGAKGAIEVAKKLGEMGADHPLEGAQITPDTQRLMDHAKAKAELQSTLTNLETDPNPRIAKVNNYPVSQIGTNPDTFQYKEGYEKGTGAGLALTDVRKYDPGLAGRLTLYRWPDGHTDVVNGHQRLAAMKRLGIDTADVQILDSKHYTPTQARAYGARINIAEGRGTPLDAATFMRDSKTSSEQLAEEGISLSESTTRDAAALYNLDDPLFRAVKLKTLPEHTGIVIGRELPDNKPAQEAILKSIREMEGKGGISDARLTETIRLAKGGENVTEEQTDLFGKRTLEQSLVPQQADILAHVREQLGKDKRLFGTVAREKGRLEAGGTEVDVGQATGISEGAATRIMMLDKSAYSRGTETNGILQKYAKLLKNSPKGGHAGVLRDAYAEVFDALNRDYQKAFTTAAPLAGVAPEAGPGQGNLLTGAAVQPRPVPQAELPPPTLAKPLKPRLMLDSTGLPVSDDPEETKLVREYLQLDRDRSEQMFGRNAARAQMEVAKQLRDRGITEYPTIFGFSEVRSPERLAPKPVGKGYTELGGTLLPGARQLIERDIVPLAQQVGTVVKGARESIQRAFAPASVSPEAAHSAGMARKYSGILEADRERAAHALETAHSYMESLPAADKTEFIDRMERGQPQPNQDQQAIANAIRRLLDQQRDEVQKLGQELKKPLLKHFYDNYFPHIWKDPAKAEQVYNGFGSKGSLEGGKSFLKHRHYDYYIEGLQAGLEPVTTNPVDLALLKHYEMGKFLRGQRIFRDLRDADYTKFVRFGQKPPVDYVKLDDKIARVYQYSEQEKGFIARGEYYVPEPIGRIINNYLSPGLKGNTLYDALRAGSNVANRMQLGFSAFHLGTTAVNSATSDVALGMMKVARGDPVAGFKHIGRGLSGTSIVADVMRGREGYREFYNPGSIGGPVANRVADYIESYGKIGTDRQFVDGWVQSFKDAVREGNVLGAVVRSPLAAAEAVGKPLFDYIIPRAKLGAFMDLAENELSKLPWDSGEQERLAVIDRVQNSIDNRFGMINYDNLFWNNKMKDLSFMLMRAPGWNIGTVREIGGAPIDLAKGRGLTPKVAYALALPLTVAVWGAGYQYARTGKFPKLDPHDLRQSWINFTKPETGRNLPNGQPERVQFPSYLKDIEGMTEHPGKTIVDKLNPVASMLADIYQNKDYQREEIRHPGDPMLEQAGQVGKFVGKELMPFSVQNLMRRRDQSVTGGSAGQGVESYLGITPAPREFTNSKAQNMMQHFEEQNIPEGARTQAQVEHSRMKRQILQQLRAGQKQPLHDALKAGQISKREAHEIGRDSLEKPFAVEFRRLTIPQAIEVYKAGTDAEKDTAYPFLVHKFKRLAESNIPPDQRGELINQLKSIEIERLTRKKRKLGGGPEP